MTAVIAFPKSRVKPVAPSKAGDAEIVIFPGVRIERRDFTLANNLPRPPRRRRSTRVQQKEADDI